MSRSRKLAQLLDTTGNVLANKLANAQAFAAGTVMLFGQTAAPTGWTKQTTNNDAALRVVSGTVGSGGSGGFSSVFTSRTPQGSVSLSGSIGSTTLDSSQIPSHNHTLGLTSRAGSQWTVNRPPAWGGDDATSPGGTKYATSDATGGGGSHNHSFSGSGSFTGTAMDFAVKYVDTIMATKD